MLRRLYGRRPHHLRGAEGRDFRFPGSQWRRQDDRHAHVVRVELPYLGQRPGGRLRRDDAGRADQAAHRLYEPALFALRRPHGAREHTPLCRRLRLGTLRDVAQHGIGAQPAALQERGRYAGGFAAAGVEAEAGLLGGYAAPAPGGFSRRAHGWGRPGDPAAVLGDDLRGGGRRYDGICHHALSG